MRRAGRLAGRGAGVVAVDLRVFAVVDVPFIRAPGLIVRQLHLRIFDLAVFGAELLAQLGGADRADLHALAAGDAFGLVNVRAVGGGGHVRGVV